MRSPQEKRRALNRRRERENFQTRQMVKRIGVHRSAHQSTDSALQRECNSLVDELDTIPIDHRPSPLESSPDAAAEWSIDAHIARSLGLSGNETLDEVDAKMDALRGGLQ